jgi:serine/alanine adding enzyme
MVTAQSVQVAKQSRELSRAIGQAKKQEMPFDELLASKRVMSASEKTFKKEVRALDDRLVELLVPLPELEPETIQACAVGTLAANEAFDASSVVVSRMTSDSIDDWDRFVDSQPMASVYHQSAIRDIVQSSFGHECFYLIARREGEVVGVLPLVRLHSMLFGNYLVSQPFFNYGGVLAVNDVVRRLLLEAAATIAHDLGCSHVEYRDREAISGLPVRTDKVAMWLTLPETQDALWQQVGSKVRAQIKRGARFKLLAQSGGVELLDDFYAVFAVNMRDLGTPVYSKAFFREILCSRLQDARLVVVRHAGKPVSVAFLIGYRGRMEVPWASTLRTANRFDANMFLYWELLCLACQSGYRTFDFGRSTEGAATYRFKKQWGAKPVPLYWHYWLREGGEPPKISPDNPKYRLVIGLWQRMPVWLTRLLGPGIVKYLP